MNSKGVKRYPLSKQVADKLEQMIEAGEYPVGERIPTEIELMDIFSVSRNTIREAVQSLNSAGVLDVRQGDGTYVRSSNRFNANMSMKYAQISIEDIREARNIMEVSIAGLAAQRRSDEDLTLIAEALDRRKGLKENGKENTLADMEFHMAIAESCHNKILIDLYHSIWSYLESHIAERHVETSLNFEQIDELHDKLYRAILAGDPAAASNNAHEILSI